MILKSDSKEFYVDDAFVLSQGPGDYVKEIVSLKIHSDDDENSIPSGELYHLSIPHFDPEFRYHDGNAIGVSAFPPFPKNKNVLELVLTFLKHYIKDDQTKIIFDNSYEGHIINPVKGIHRIIDTLNIDPSRVYFYTGGAEAEIIYNEFCQRVGIQKKINIKIINTWERHLFLSTKSIDITPSFEIKNREKIFLCFNRMARKHRVALLGLMNDKDLVSKGYYSFFPANHSTENIKELIGELTNYISCEMHQKIADSLDRINDQLPLKLNVDSIDDNVNYVKNDDSQFYQNSYFSLVTETFFFGNGINATMDENSVFFSEKIFKPIAHKHPFVMLNRPRALQYLRLLGYKTFAPYIDESYDLINNDEQRMIAIVDEVKRLSEMTSEDWIKWQENVKPIVEHNYRIFNSKRMQDHMFSLTKIASISNEYNNLLKTETRKID